MTDLPEKIRQALAANVVLTWNGMLISAGPKGGGAEGTPYFQEIHERVALALEGAAEMAEHAVRQARWAMSDTYPMNSFALELRTLAATIRQEGQRR